MPSVRIPHECCQPAATALNWPPGGRPTWSPQQVMVLSVRNPHEWSQPVVTSALNCPPGASPSLLEPQQVMVPSVRNPHE